MITGLLARAAMIVAKWSATWPIDLCANASGCSLASVVVSGWALQSAWAPGGDGQPVVCTAGNAHAESTIPIGTSWF